MITFSFQQKCRLVGILLFALVACREGRGQAVISGASVLKEIGTGPSLAFVIRIAGTNLATPENPRVVIFPSTGITSTNPPVITPTLVTTSFTASRTYVPLEVTLSYSTGPVTKEIAGTSCAPDIDVDKHYFYVPQAQVAKKYGNGVAKNFDVIQVSVVNKCPLPILIPLAGVYLELPPSTPPVFPFSLEHVTTIYSNDRQFSGPRAVFFNIVQGMATVGSAIEPFFGHGFTQGVSILGGGFTQGAATIWKDLSAEQLQNLTSQSFQATEQVAASGGALQKSIFIARHDKKPTKLLNKATDLKTVIHLEIIPVLTAKS